MYQYNKFLIFFLSSFLFPFLLNATELKIASYNVENLFDMVHDGSEYKEYIPNQHHWTHANLNKKLLNLSEVICDINADIIGLQEVENENVLKLLQKTLRSVGCFYKYSTMTHKKNSAIQVALLSKIPIQYSNEIVVSQKLGYRNILEVKFMIEKNPFFIYVNHWNSKRLAESTRMVSARALRNRLAILMKERDYILLGDFNSNYNEYQHIEPKHNDTHGETGINHILQTTISDKLVEEKNMKSKNFQHYNLWLELPNFQRWSHNFFGKKQGLDAIVLPPSLFDGKGLDYVNDSFKVLKPSYLFHKNAYINRWQYKYERHLGKGYSDHLPIMATFSTQPYIFDDKRQIRTMGSIEDLYVKEISNSLYLKEVKVILKRAHHAIIKQSKNGRAIFVYGAEGLDEGASYDIVVHKTKTYKGLHEIVDFSIEYAYGKSNIDDYFYKNRENLKIKKLENEVLKNLNGVYKKGKFYVDGKGYPIFFKKSHARPKEESRLKLYRVQIGYYDGMQLVVWDAEDFTVLE
ncbi:hypothetical protein KKC13_08290 [bacterium]|nr:hypothetical protein [bacterium]MBU1959461.1 hypothetical protein [bacterium]